MDFVRLPLSRDARAAHLQPEPLRLLCLYTEAALLARLQRRAQLPRPHASGPGSIVHTPTRLRQVDKMNTKLPNFGGSNAAGNDSKYFQTTKKGAPQRQRLALLQWRTPE